MTKRLDLDLAKENSAFAHFPISEEADPSVIIPADVRASIARSNAAAIVSSRGDRSEETKIVSDFRTGVTDQDTQDDLDRHLESLELAAKGKRQQPPMTNRLRAIMIVVARKITDGTPFAVGPNSIMNQRVRAWLNARAARTPDERKSRRKQITPGAVRALLRQIKPFLPPTCD